MHYSEQELLPYRVGGLLYTPATNHSILEKLNQNAIPCLTSIVFCLEDSIGDTELDMAEKNLKNMISQWHKKKNKPLCFIRVRSPQHLLHMGSFLEEKIRKITGFVLPKFDESNLQEYFRAIEMLEQKNGDRKYIMPILETKSIAKCEHRAEKLENLKQSMQPMKKRILNVRVGGNDFSNLYGLRRNAHQNIYQMGIIRDILMDILNVFSDDYIVSGPVWEYFGSGTDTCWMDGLKNELELDRLNGFIGKTAIHPSQLPIIYESMKPSKSDYCDAQAILHWSNSAGAKKSDLGDRMNERKTHLKWARKIDILAAIYGIRGV